MQCDCFKKFEDLIFVDNKLPEKFVRIIMVYTHMYNYK